MPTKVPEPIAFIEMLDGVREKRVKGIDKASLLALLLAVADIAAQDRKGITNHPYLQTAHRDLKALKERIKDHPCQLQDLRQQVRFFEEAYSAAKKRGEEVEGDLLRLQQRSEQVTRDYEAERARLLEGVRQVEDAHVKLIGQYDQKAEQVDLLHTVIERQAALGVANEELSLAVIAAAAAGINLIPEA